MVYLFVVGRHRLLGGVLLAWLAVVATGGRPCRGFHADFFLTQQEGELLTGRGGADPGQNGIPGVGIRFHVNEIAGLAPFVDVNPGIRAEDANDSFFATHPQYEPLPDGALLGFSLAAVRVGDGPAANLFYWDGMGEVDFAPVTSALDALEIRSTSGASVLATGEAEYLAGFDFIASDNGSVHTHLIFDLDADNNPSTPASTGMFLAALEFQMDLDADGSAEVARPHYLALFNGPPGTAKTTALAATNEFLETEFAALRLWGDVTPLADDQLPDDLVDADDLTTLAEAIRTGSNDLLYDLNHDSLIDQEDWELLLGTILKTTPGDADLDRDVDAADLAAWEAGFGQDAGWAGGDFSGSGLSSGRDALIWLRNYSPSGNSPAVAVPEPTSSILLFVLAGLVARQGRFIFFFSTKE